MMKLSQYFAHDENLPKLFCSLAEKCYYNNLKCYVYAPNKSYAESLDQVLWTYSRKHYIPHALDTDPSEDDHPIIISEKFPSKDNYQSIITYNISEKYAEIINKLGQIYKNLDRIVSIFDEKNLDLIKNLTPEITEFNIESFLQSDQGKWEKL